MKRILLAVTFASIATVAIQASHISDAEALKAQAAASKAAANKLLLKSASHGDLAGIEAALKMNADVNGVDSQGNTALEGAIIDERSEVVKKLLTMPDIDLRPQALLLAVATGNIDIVDDILNARADVNAQDIHDGTALTVAINNNDGQMVTFLLGKGADVDAQRQRDGVTALMLAAANFQANLITILLAEGADIMLEDKMGRTAVDYIKIDESDSEAYRKHKITLKNMLQKRFEASSKEAANKLLLESVSCGDLAGIEAALKMNADVNVEDSRGNRALENAIIYERSEVVKKLLTMPDIDLRPQALLLAVATGNIDIVDDILNARADVNAQDIHDGTALTVAINNNDGQMVTFLLGKGADVDAQRQRDGVTALMLAAANFQANLITILLAEGADIMLEDKMGRTAVDYIKIDESDSEAYRKHKITLKNMLQKKLADAETKRLEFIRQKRAKRVGHIKAGIEPRLNRLGGGGFALQVAKEAEKYLRPTPDKEKTVFDFEWEQLNKAIQAVGATGRQAQVDAFITIYKEDIKRLASNKPRLTDEQKDILSRAKSLYEGLMKLEKQKERSKKLYSCVVGK